MRGVTELPDISICIVNWNGEALLGPLLLGLLWDEFGARSAFLTAAAFAAVSLMLLRTIVRPMARA